MNQCNLSLQPDADQSDSSFQAVTELRVKLRKTEDVVSSLTQDKAELVSDVTRTVR